MHNRIDLGKFIEDQSNERYKSFIVLANILTFTEDIKEKIIDSVEGNHLDLIQIFKSNRELSKNIDVFDVDNLKSLLNQSDNNSEIIFVTGLDMIWNIWTDFEKNRFVKMIEKDTISSPFSNKLYCFFMIKDQYISQIELLNTYGKSRVVPIDKFIIRGTI
ncbi:hypothetical protein ACFFGV_20250 [Pontibacillus salicampi]|uniref:BREX-3 system P-loop-containing protein BrxF n=1 Tax=Pontibacillus salicampi TaxID=1449801 RepID=A0ABV6LU19_9BACI